MRCMFKGKITNILPEREYGVKKIKEREIWCIEEGQESFKFPTTLAFVSRFDPTSDTINPLPQINNLKMGDNVEFAFIPKSRFWRRDGDVKCILSLKIASDINVVGSKESHSNNTQADPDNAHMVTADDIAEDMPF